jgi:nitroreductase
MFSQRSIRRFRPDRVPVSDIELILEAASKAPNGGNRQIARFLVVDDPATIREFGKLYFEAWWAKRRDTEGWTGPDDMSDDERQAYAAPMRLAHEMAEVPCVIMVLSVPSNAPESVLPAVQNLMLAARALGIGSVPTRLHPQVMDRFRSLFGLPEEVVLHLAVPLGYPRGRFGPTRRLPTWQTSYYNKWGTPVPWTPAADHD